MLDYIYHMTLRSLRNHISALKCYNVSLEAVNHYGLLILLHGVISLPDATLCDEKK